MTRSVCVWVSLSHDRSVCVWVSLSHDRTVCTRLGRGMHDQPRGLISRGGHVSLRSRQGLRSGMCLSSLGKVLRVCALTGVSCESCIGTLVVSGYRWVSSMVSRKVHAWTLQWIYRTQSWWIQHSPRCSMSCRCQSEIGHLLLVLGSLLGIGLGLSTSQGLSLLEQGLVPTRTGV